MCAYNKGTIRKIQSLPCHHSIDTTTIMFLSATPSNSFSSFYDRSVLMYDFVHLHRMKDPRTESPSGQAILLWWQSTTSWWSEQGNKKWWNIKDWCTATNPFYCSSQTSFLFLFSLSLCTSSLSFRDREIQLYELSTLEPYCQISALDTIPLTLDYGWATELRVNIISEKHPLILNALRLVFLPTAPPAMINVVFCMETLK